MFHLEFFQELSSLDEKNIFFLVKIAVVNDYITYFNKEKLIHITTNKISNICFNILKTHPFPITKFKVQIIRQ